MRMRSGLLVAALATALLCFRASSEDQDLNKGVQDKQPNAAEPKPDGQQEAAVPSGTPVRIDAGRPAFENGKTPEQREANKLSVMKQLEALFKNSAKPLVPSKLITPAKPYMSVINGRDDRVTVLYRCRFVKSKTIVDAMESVVSTSGTVEDSPDQNIVVVNDVKDKAEDLKEALVSLDIPLPQILVEAHVIEINLTQDLQKDVKAQYKKYNAATKETTTYGYDLTPPSTNSSMTDSSNGFSVFPYSSGSADGNYSQFNVAVKLVALSRDAKVLSSPNMIVDLGTTASMITGEDVPIQSTSVTSSTVTTSTTFKRIGVKLNVTPTLINKDIVQLEVNPEVSSIISYQTFEQNDVTVKTPVIGVRNIKTRLSAADGQIIMLGGLYYSESITEENKVPFFGDIPYLGEAFNSKYQTNVDKQLLFFMKIHILQSADSVLLDPETRALEIRTIGHGIHQSDIVFPEKPKNSLPERTYIEKLDDALDSLDEEQSGASRSK